VTNSWERLTPTAMAAIDVINHGVALYRAKAASPTSPYAPR
jgi:hypothetical protein